MTETPRAIKSLLRRYEKMLLDIREFNPDSDHEYIYEGIMENLENLLAIAEKESDGNSQDIY